MTRSTTRLTALVIVGLLGSATTFACLPASGPRTLTRFEPDRLADLELDMWKAYYSKERLRLFGLLTTTLREQYGYSWVRSVQAGVHLARAASDFSGMHGDYNRVLPDLEAAFTIARDWTSASFDPRDAARAELAWWVARRTPADASVTIVGQRIADSYIVLYQVPLDRVSEAGQLRAEAAHLRDTAADRPDWERIRGLLQRSYRSLKQGVSREKTPINR